MDLEAYNHVLSDIRSVPASPCEQQQQAPRLPCRPTNTYQDSQRSAYPSAGVAWRALQARMSGLCRGWCRGSEQPSWCGSTS